MKRNPNNEFAVTRFNAVLLKVHRQERGRPALGVLFLHAESFQRVLQNYNQRSKVTANCSGAIHRIRAMAMIFSALCHPDADAMNRVPTMLRRRTGRGSRRGWRGYARR